MDEENATLLVSSEEESILMQTVEAIVNKKTSNNTMEEVNTYFLMPNAQNVEKKQILDSASSTLIFNESNNLPWSKMCRICASNNDYLIPIFQDEGAEHQLCAKIHKHLPIRISERDNLPLKLCYHCAATILAWSELSEGCLQAENQLLQMQNDYNKIQQQSDTSNLNNQNATKLSTMTEHITNDNDLHLKQITVSKEVAKLKDENQLLTVNDSDRSSKIQTPFKTYLEMQNINWKTLKKPTNLSSKQETIMENSEPIWITMIESNTNVDQVTNNEITVQEVSRLSDAEEAQSRPVNKRKVHKDAVRSKRKEDKKKSVENQDTYQCEECGRAFKLKDSFTRHMRIHNDERPFTCHVCGKQFRDSGGLSRHLRDVHAKLKNFSCDICGNSFASKATRDDHHRTHTGERPYVCDSCGKAFKSKASLYIHSKLHTDEFPHSCTYCSKKFRRRHEMLSHVTTHTGEKNYPCDICAKRFRVRSELVRHKLVHSKDKPFTCDLCNLAFRQKRYLNSHIKSRHSLKKLGSIQVCQINS